MKVLVSVYNISGYLMAELSELSKSAEIAVIETPCDVIPKWDCVSRWIDRTRLQDLGDVASALKEFKPDVYLCGGWADKLFVRLARNLRKAGTTTVLAVDTPWQGRSRQFAHCLYSRFYLTTAFDLAWGSGEPQARYLRYLGFPAQRIRIGYYCADTGKFGAIGNERQDLMDAVERCQAKWPHVFLYVGRYVQAKNMRRMERAFLDAVGQNPGSDWILRCIGGGDLWDERTIHPRIEHLGYKSPAEIQNHVKDAVCFVLPSVFEPWGVVVHEAALMGLPMLCSNQVQATTKYLKAGGNGLLFDPLDEKDMASAFSRFMKLPDRALSLMGRVSLALGRSYSLSDWADHMKSFRRPMSGSPARFIHISRR